MISSSDIVQIGRGILMGGADIIPGVSGGTVALILGIYERLVVAISRFDRALLAHVRRRDWTSAAAHVDLRFLMTLGLGIAIGIGGLASLMHFLLESPEYRPPTLAFFFGLILASSVLVGRMIERWRLVAIAAAVAATGFAYWLVGLMPAEPPEGYGYLFLCGAIAICAMILPGISGSFILVLLGKYAYVLNAVNRRDILDLFWVVAGAVVGIVTFAQFLGWLFRRYHDVTVAVLTGLMLGSLRKVWPWKVDVAWMTGRHGEQIPTVQHNVLPDALTPDVMFAIALAITGLVLVLALDWWASRVDPEKRPGT